MSYEYCKSHCSEKPSDGRGDSQVAFVMTELGGAVRRVQHRSWQELVAEIYRCTHFSVRLAVRYVAAIGSTVIGVELRVRGDTLLVRIADLIGFGN